MITIGIDPHKASLTAVALDATGRQLAVRRVAVNAGAYKTLMGWAARWPQRRFAVEGAAGLGRGIAQLLAGGGEDVVDVPATLAARARLLDTGGARKSDPADAASVAHAAMRHKRLRTVVAEDHSTRLRLLSERRDDLASERVRVLNRLHVLLRDLIPGGAAPDLTAEKAATLLRGMRPISATDTCRRDLARDLIADLRRLDRQLHTNQAQTRQALAETHSTITNIHGVAHILAGKILGHVGDVTRFPTTDHFASYTGTAPLEASSGERRRHRLNPTGNRQLNTAIHTIAVCQARDPGPAASTTSAKSARARHPPRPDEQPGIAVSLTGASSGSVHVSVEVHDLPPPQPDAAAMAGWDEVVEQSILSPGGDLRVAALSADPPKLPVLCANGPGQYRIRLHARGREIAPDGVAFEPVEEYHFVVWPQATRPEVAHRLTDRYGAKARTAAPIPPPPPQDLSDFERSVEERIRRASGGAPQPQWPVN
ncbi:transposase [Micromonospora profundi]|uniref:IS110 family transposase n=1 Tax=Micromonospora profundi TaxID=1420889 RepID=UPI0014389861|nr:IS110 family transposase [Micromonospora profundi]NJC13057.1 transposase [Micromonospora profundi]